MIRNYENPKINQNLKTTKILSIISLVLAFLILIVEIFSLFINKKLNHEYFFYVFLITIPWNLLNFAKANYENPSSLNKRPKNQPPLLETSTINDFSSTLFAILLSFLPYFLLVFFSIISFCSGDFKYMGSMAYVCGQMFLSHIFVYIADIFLICNCIYIKKEWRANPPDFEKRKIENKKQESENRQKKLCINLIEESGVKFFIKYYNQIKNLPLRDIEIMENYDAKEKQERISSVKKIIDSNLTELVVNEILIKYNDILEKQEIENLQFILTQRKDKNL